MPTILWEWKAGPQTIISGLMLLVMIGGFIKFFFDIETEVKLAQLQVANMQSQVIDMKGSITTVTERQRQVISDVADAKAKIDIILPTVQRIEDFILRRGDNSLAKPTPAR